MAQNGHDTKEAVDDAQLKYNAANKEAYRTGTVGYHHPDYIKPYKGCNTHFPFYLVQPDVDIFQARPEDTVICGFPKSGSSRLSAIAGMILNDGDSSFLQSGPNLDQKAPFFEFCTPLNEKGPRSIDMLNKQPGGRLYFTHLAFTAAPQSLLTNKAKVIYHIRNPKDVMITLYYHFISRILSNFHGDLNEMVDAFTEDRIVYGPYFDHLASYWKLRNEPNVLIVSFEHLSENFQETAKQISSFLGKDLTQEQLRNVEHETSFQQMKANARTNRYDKHIAGIYDHNISPFLRCGVPGGWREHLTPAMNAKVNAWITKNLARPDLEGLAERFASTFTLH
ncbi:putative Sulfotransferase family cytosolic 1B member 1 [Hypsibius exemplaris]|uniref:Sulfotransferase family cytosolic 1B member 1 n=1 Tax=Hypsibius exemplaris TaxID=2072580 RepID=A0A1W0X123_HYPEX|nr:putative Sulfotransferase family cytosolic 1B member 1 [Hypsibius exemplaris]